LNRNLSREIEIASAIFYKYFLYVRKDLRAQAEALLPLHLEKGLNVALDKCLLLEVGIGRRIEY
jgi:hypothetical protein